MKVKYEAPNNNDFDRNTFREENKFRENLKLIRQKNILNNNSIEYNIKSSNDNSLFTSQKETKEDTKLKSLITKISNIFSEILSKYESEPSILYNILKEIIYSITLIISEFSDLISNKETIESESFNNLNRAHYLDTDSNSKVVLHLKIGKLNKKIKSLTNEIQIMKNGINISSGNSNKNYYDYFLKKLTAIKSKYQDNELKYLLYIEEQKNKISNLEKELKKHIKENLQKDVLKTIKCFPNFIQYNVKENINPKSIPLSQMKLTRNKIYHSSNKSKIQKFLFDLENNTCASKDNKFFKTECNNNGILNKNKKLLFNGDQLITNKSKNKIFENTSIDFNDIERAKTYEKIPQIIPEYYIDSSSENSYENNLKTLQNKKEIIQSVNDYKPNILINKKKQFFIAHPNMKLAEIEKERTFNNILRKLKVKPNKNKNLKKNSFAIFPSYLNEKMINLEKFKRNILTIESDLEASNTIRKKMKYN